MPAPMARLMTWRAGRRMGLLLMNRRKTARTGSGIFSSMCFGKRACSLPQAMTEPVKVTAPMMVPSPISSSEAVLMLPFLTM